MSSIRKEIKKIIDDLPEEHLLELKQLIQAFTFVKGEASKEVKEVSKGAKEDYMREEIKESKVEEIKKEILNVEKDDKTLNQEALDFLFENYDETLRNLKNM